MNNKQTEELINRLYKLVEDWEQRQSNTGGDVAFDIGIEQTYEQCVDELKELIEFYEK